MAGTFLAEYGRTSKIADIIRFLNDVLLSAPSIPMNVITRLPRMALAMPPPTEPGPGVGSVSRAGVKPFTPSTISISRIEPSTTMPSSVAKVLARIRTRSAIRPSSC
jgi:hypothetical protein